MIMHFNFENTKLNISTQKICLFYLLQAKREVSTFCYGTKNTQTDPEITLYRVFFFDACIL